MLYIIPINKKACKNVEDGTDVRA